MKKLFLTAIFCAVYLGCLRAVAFQSYSGLDFQSWRVENFVSSSVDENGFTGVSAHWPFLYTPVGTTIDAETNPQMEVLLESNESYFTIYFAHADEQLSEERKLVCPLNASQMAGVEPVVVQCAKHPLWKGTITILRFDIGLEGENHIGVHQVLFRTRSENAVPNGDFALCDPKDVSRAQNWAGGHLKAEGQLVLSPGEEAVSELVEVMPEGGVLALRLNAQAGVSMRVRILDIYGRELDCLDANARDNDSGISEMNLSPEAATVQFVLCNANSEGDATATEVYARLMPRQGAWQAKWIWAKTNDPFARVVLRRRFTLNDLGHLTAAQVQVTADDELTLRLNGHLLECKNAMDWRKADYLDVTDLLREGENFVEAYVVNTDTYGGLLGEVDLLYDDGRTVVMFTDHEWEYAITGVTGHPGPSAAEAFDVAKNFRPAIEQGPAGCGPWGVLPTRPLPLVRAKCRATGLRKVYRPDEVLELFPELYERKLVIPEQVARAANLPSASVYLENGRLSFPVATLGHEAPSEDGAVQRLDAIRVPLNYLPNGEWTVRMELPGVLAEGPFVLGKFTLTGQGGSELPDTKLLFRNGIPYFRLNNTEEILTDHCLLDMTDSEAEYAEESNLLANDVKGVWLHYRNWKYDAATDEFSFKALDRLCTRVLLRNPTANFMICVLLDSEALQSWLDVHPEACCCVYGGSTQITNYSGTKSEYPSLASPEWLAFGDRLLTALVEHLRSMPYGARVIGLAPSSGITWEWMYWGSQSSDYCDYSRPFLQGFRAWMRERYEDDIAKLQAAWQSQDASFDELELPTPAERKAAGIADLHDPVKSRKVIDFQDFFSQVVSDAIVHYCDTVKRLTDNRLLAGAYYGYTTFVLSGQWIPRIGHFALARVLDAPSVDFHISPTRYSDREMGGAGGYMPPEASAVLRGKMYVCESDIRTVHAATDQFGKVWTLMGSRAVIEREMGANIASGVSTHWYDFSQGWIGGDTRLAQVAGKLQTIEEEIRTAEPALDDWTDKRDTIAVFIDERSHVTQVMGSPLAYLFSGQQYAQLYRSGAKIDQYLFTDLPKVGDQYQCLVFLNAWRLTEEDLQTIEALKGDGRTMLFQYGVGVTTEQGVSPDNTERILGVPFAMDTTRMPRLMALTAAGKEFFGADAPTTLRTYDAYGPLFTPEIDEGAPVTVLGTLADGRPAMIQVQNDNCKLFFCALPQLPGAWLAAIAKTAGVTVYDDNHFDVVWAGHNVLTIHAIKGGERRLNFPCATGMLKNLLTGEELAIRNGVSEVTIPDNSTTLFRIIPQ
ncbi:MAG: beta-galactosidase [Victivallales bacterium]|nr:beta-galactosidase [Victivallales bacterium]